MKDKHDTSTMELDITVVTPEMVERCLTIAGNTMQEHPYIRLGQGFINALWEEYQVSVTWPELFYEVDVNKAYAMIISEYYEEVEL